MSVDSFSKDDVIETGRHRYRFVPTPHLPHGWDAGVLYEETTGTLMCGDLFTQLGDDKALTEGDAVTLTELLLDGDTLGLTELLLLALALC